MVLMVNNFPSSYLEYVVKNDHRRDQIEDKVWLFLEFSRFVTYDIQLLFVEWDDSFTEVNDPVGWHCQMRSDSVFVDALDNAEVYARMSRE